MDFKPYTSYQYIGIEWLKEIPSEWSISKVKHCFFRKNEKAYQEDPIVLSLARDGVKVRDISTGEGQIAESYFHYNPVKPGDLLLNPMDLVSGANCSLSEVEGVISPAYINLNAKNGINPKYYDYFFKLQYWSMALFAHGKGVSFENRWTINNETLMNYIIPVPDEYTQNKIVGFLEKKSSKINEIIVKNNHFIGLLEEKKKTLINQVITKGLTSNISMKNSGIDCIGKIPVHWDVFKLKFLITSIESGKRKESEGDNYAFSLGGEHINWNGTFDFSNKRFISKNFFNSMTKGKIEKNDILLVKDGATIGKTAFVEKLHFRMAVNEHVFIIRNNDLILPKLLYYFISSNIGFLQIKLTETGSAQGGISQDISDKVYFSLPLNLKEQQELINFLDEKISKIDKTIKNIEKNIELLEEYKISLIHHVVTGKIDVRDEL